MTMKPNPIESLSASPNVQNRDKAHFLQPNLQIMYRARINHLLSKQIPIACNPRWDGCKLFTSSTELFKRWGSSCSSNFKIMETSIRLLLRRLRLTKNDFPYQPSLRSQIYSGICLKTNSILLAANVSCLEEICQVGSHAEAIKCDETLGCEI